MSSYTHNDKTTETFTVLEALNHFYRDVIGRTQSLRVYEFK